MGPINPDRSTARRAAAAAVAAAAGLLLANIGLAFLIARRARQITDSLDRAREHAAPLFDLPQLNSALERTTSQLRELRTGGEG